MDRPIIEVGELPCAEDFLGLAKDALYGFGMMASAAIGPGTGVAGLAIAPTGPASLSFTIGPGSIYEPETVDATAYGVLGTDANTIIKQGILAAPVTLTVTPPSTSGFSQVYIVQVAYSDVDGGAALVPFFNSLDPLHPSSSTQNTVRFGTLVVQLKAGTAASTGSQLTPSPDPGFTALWAVTVANGATTVTSANWQQLSVNGLPLGAPWFPNLESLNSLFQQVIQVNTTFFVNNASGSDTTGNGSLQFPWATISHAVSVISTFNLGGNTITIQLANTGVAYNGPGPVSAPSNGTLIIRGDPSAQGSYVINQQSGLLSVFSISSGSVSLVGVTLVATTAIANSCCLSANTGVTLQNVTFHTSVSGISFLLVSGAGGFISIVSGCIMGGNATNMWIAEQGGVIAQNANIATAGPPAFTNVAVAIQSGSITVNSGTWTGTGATGAKFLAAACGTISSNGGGVNFFPGSTAGTASTGGQYI